MKLINADKVIKTLRARKKLFCRNQIEFRMLSPDQKARVDEIDTCIAELVNAEEVPHAQLGTNLAEVGTDCISRQAAIEAIDKEQKEIGVSDASAIYECSRFKTIIKRLPTAQPEPCEDAVSRKDMLAELDEWREAFDENGHKESCSDMKLVRKFMALLPSAQPERKRGKWVFKNDLVTVPNGYWECSECKEGRLLYEENFCPHCGADMRGKQDG